MNEMLEQCGAMMEAIMGADGSSWMATMMPMGRGHRHVLRRPALDRATGRDRGRHCVAYPPRPPSPDWRRCAARSSIAAGLVRSLDGGANWQPLAYPGAPLAGGIAAATDGSVLCAATSAGLRRSTDQGQTWQQTAFDGVALAAAIAPDDPMDVAVVDDATRFYRSSDGGASWPEP